MSSGVVGSLVEILSASLLGQIELRGRKYPCDLMAPEWAPRARIGKGYIMYVTRGPSRLGLGWTLVLCVVCCVIFHSGRLRNV
jgi:hypothetical protein